MKRLLKVTALTLVAALGTSCTTTFDSYGNRRQAIDPAGAAIGAVALGAIAYSVGKNRGERHERRRQKFDQPQFNQGWGANQGWNNRGFRQQGPYYR